MAAAIFNCLARKMGVAVSAASAGTMPADRVHPNVVQVMKEWEINLSAITPRVLTDQDAAEAARIITMGCEVDAKACPAIFLKDVEDWALADPKGLRLEETREVRDEIARRVLRLIQSILNVAEPPAS